MVETPLKVIHLLEDLQQAEHLSMLACVWAAINKVWRLTVWELEVDAGVPKTTVSKSLLQDLGMKYVLAKFVQQILF